MLINDNVTLNNLMEKVMASNSAIKKLDNINIDDYYNCYCFVAKIFGWVEELSWLHWDEMEAYLKENTKAIRKPKIGDIMVWRNTYDKSLEHTALIIDENDLSLLQKPGGCHLEYGTYNNNGLEHDYTEYNYKITYRRVLL